jgi:hypothetical protein
MKSQSSHCCLWFILVHSSNSITPLLTSASTIASPAASPAPPEPYICTFTPSADGFLVQGRWQRTVLHSLSSGGLQHRVTSPCCCTKICLLNATRALVCTTSMGITSRQRPFSSVLAKHSSLLVSKSNTKYIAHSIL